jgi:transcriptional regulator with XRE-family HTH domain
VGEKKEQEFKLPRLTGREFDFIRKNAGLTFQDIADFTGKLSRSTIYNWTLQRELKPFQVKYLMEMIPEDVFETCRLMYKEMTEENEARMQAAKERGEQKRKENEMERQRKRELREKRKQENKNS